MTTRSLVFAIALVSCGPPIASSADGGKDGGASDAAADASDEPLVTSGTMSATIGGSKFSASTVGARRVEGGRLEIVGSRSNETITIAVPASVGTFTCTDAPRASVTYRSAASTCTVIVSAVSTKVTGVFSASPDISDGTFSVTIAD